MVDSGLPVQIAQALLRHTAHGSVQHIISAQACLSSSVEAYDLELKRAWERVLGLTFSDRAWNRAQLPLRDGGLTSGAIGLTIPRAAVAFSAAWSGTADYVSEVGGFGSVDELLEADSVLRGELQAAADKLKDVGLPSASVRWEDGRFPPPFKQTRVLRNLSAIVRKHGLESVSDMEAA